MTIDDVPSSSEAKVTVVAEENSSLTDKEFSYKDVFISSFILLQNHVKYGIYVTRKAVDDVRETLAKQNAQVWTTVVGVAFLSTAATLMARHYILTKRRRKEEGCDKEIIIHDQNTYRRPTAENKEDTATWVVSEQVLSINSQVRHILTTLKYQEDSFDNIDNNEISNSKNKYAEISRLKTDPKKYSLIPLTPIAESLSPKIIENQVRNKQTYIHMPPVIPGGLGFTRLEWKRKQQLKALRSIDEKRW